MCFFGRSSTPQPPKPEFDDAPPVVTGKQTGVDNPIDTKKVTEQLRQDRMKEEGFSNPAESLKIAGVTGGGGKYTVKKVNGKLTKMTKNAYRKTLRSKPKTNKSNGGRVGGRV